jgi:hypothetical protein
VKAVLANASNGDAPDAGDGAYLALMYIVEKRGPEYRRALKRVGKQTLIRLHQKGWIVDPKDNGASVELTDQGRAKARELLRAYSSGR